MERVNLKKLGILAILVTVCLCAIIITLSYVFKAATPEEEVWVLHSYGNNVALYNGEDVVEVYGTILLDTLPEADKRQLENGIAFPTKAEAVLAIEDYDG
ncbi:MAG: hypothetical protein E7560_02830 [Ruminococcaceae bacterium]|nr:hypothetical protein [Oscillospiraceae bacterium]